MAQSTDSVFVMVEHDLLPVLTVTLKDAVGNAVPRAGYTAVLVVRPVAGGTATRIAMTWEDSPTNTRPQVVWTSGTRLATGIYYAEVETDPNGTKEWTFPTEQPFQIIVRAGMG